MAVDRIRGPVEAGNTCKDSVTFSATFSITFSSFCWPYRASNKYLTGPIGLANDPLLLLARKGQQKLENVTENVAENVAESLRVFPASTGPEYDLQPL